MSQLFILQKYCLPAVALLLSKFNHFAEIARRNFETNGYDEKISLIEGSASDVIPALPPEFKFDLAFIDGHKEAYADYVRLLSTRLQPGGIIVVDDALFHGDVLNQEATTDKGRGVTDLLALVTDMSDWSRILLPISNGILLLQKPKQ